MLTYYHTACITVLGIYTIASTQYFWQLALNTFGNLNIRLSMHADRGLFLNVV